MENLSKKLCRQAHRQAKEKDCVSAIKNLSLAYMANRLSGKCLKGLTHFKIDPKGILEEVPLKKLGFTDPSVFFCEKKKRRERKRMQTDNEKVKMKRPGSGGSRF